MKKTKKALASLAIAGMVLSMAPVSVFAADDTRLAGADRYATSIKIAEKAYASATTAVIAAGNQANLVDALAAAPLAAQEDAPILLTDKSDMNDEVKAALTKMGVKNVIVVGAAASDAVVNELKAAGFVVEPIKGAGRVETAQMINAKLTSPAGTFVVGYSALADAMSVASYAAANNYAIVVADSKGSVPAGTKANYVIGGPTLVQTIEGAKRIAGANRWETNQDVLNELTYEYDNIYVAGGNDANLADALVASVLAGQTNSPIALTDGKTVLAAKDLGAKMTATSQVWALGGTAVVSDAVKNSVKYQAPSTLAVEGVSASNLIQVSVTYTQNVEDNDDAKDADNYTFEGVAVGEDSADEITIADVSVSGNVVTLTFAEAVENQTEGTLTIDEAVIGDELEFEDIKFFDTTLPTVVGAEVVGNDTVKVTFSEPIDFSALTESELEDQFDLNDGEFFVKSVTPMENNTEANVEFYTTFKTGDYTIAVDNDLEDYAGFNVVPKSFDLDVVEDTTAPKLVGYKDVTPTKITLVFDEDIEPADGTTDLTTADFFHTNSKNPADTAVIVNGNEIDLTFDSDYELPNGTAYVYVEDEAIRDLWDNENEQRLSIAVKVEVDETAPTVKEVEVSAQDELVLTFSEELDETTAEKEVNYTLLDKDGEEVKISNATLQANDDGDMVEVVLDLGDEIYGAAKLTVEDVEDEAGNAMDAQTLEFVAEDETAPLFTDFTATLYDVDEDVYTIVVDFDEEMSVSGKYSVVDLEKYEIAGVNLADIDSDDIKITAIDGNEKVRIEIKVENSEDLVVAAEDVLVIARVADAAGNYTAGLASAASGDDAIAITGESTVAVDKVQATDNDKIVVTLDGKVVDFEANDFIVYYGTTTSQTLQVAGAKIDNSGDDSVITITLDEDNELTDDGKYEGETVHVMTALSNIGTENAYGEPVAIAEGVAKGVAKDKIVPELAEVEVDGDDVDDVAFTATTVVLTFTEAIDAATVSKYSFSVEDITVDTVTVSGNVVTLNLLESDADLEDLGVGTKVTQKLSIYDAAGNALSGISTQVEYAAE